MVTTKLNLSMTEPQVRQIYAKQGDTGRVLDITLDQTPEDGTLRILRPDGVEVTSEAVTGGEVSESGDVVTFESLTEADVTELTVGIEPVQDLNGYDAPWVGGAGKNKLNFDRATITSNGITLTNNGDGTYTVNGTSTALAIFQVQQAFVSGQSYILSGCPSGGSPQTYCMDTYNSSVIATNARDYGSGSPAFTADGDNQQVRIIVFSGVTVNNLVFKPMIRLATETDATFAPYSNICPITGHDEVTVTRTGKNLFSGDTVSLAKPSTRTENVQIETIPAGTYVLSWEYNGTSTDTRVYFRKGSNVTADQVEVRLTQSSPVTVTFTVDMVIAYFFIVASQTDGVTAEISKMMIRKVGTSDSYEPYRSNTYTTSLGQTVYGGTLDMVSGVLTVDKAIVDFDGDANESWSFIVFGGNGYYRAYIAVSDIDTTVENMNVADIASNQFSAIAYSAGASTTGISSRKDVAQINVFQQAITTLALWREHLSANPLQVVYKLAEPVTYQLTAQQIKTLVGTNNVWASSGDIVNITFTYGGLLSELPSEATEIVGKCYCDVEQNGVSSMPFTLNVKKNERQ